MASSVRMGVRAALVEVRVGGGPELPAKRFQPVLRRTKEVVLVTGVLLLDGPGVGGHVWRLEGRTIVEDAGVVAAVEVGVGLDEEVVGEGTASIAEQDGEQVGGLGAIALPGLKPRFEARHQCEAGEE